MVAPAPGHGPMRAPHADREQVVDVLKAAFVQGQLTQDELDARVGQAPAARTYAELAALTAGLPAEPARSPAPAVLAMIFTVLTAAAAAVVAPDPGRPHTGRLPGSLVLGPAS
jgi:Domain of unknown function (DUF1707)